MDLINRLEWFVPMRTGVFYREQLVFPVRQQNWGIGDRYFWVPLMQGVCC